LALTLGSLALALALWLFCSSFFLPSATFTLSGFSLELQVTPKAPSAALFTSTLPPWFLRYLLGFYFTEKPQQQASTTTTSWPLSTTNSAALHL